MEDTFRFADELGPSTSSTFTVQLSTSKRSSRLTTSPADRRSAALGGAEQPSPAAVSSSSPRRWEVELG